MNDKVFHGCMNKNNDGTNHIIEKNHTCVYPTNVPFWKRARDVDFRVRTHSQETRQNAVKLQDFNRYCRHGGPKDIKRWLYADESELYYLKKNDCFFVVK